MNAQLRTSIVSGVVGGSLMLACLMAGADRAGAGWDSPLRWIAAFLASEPGLIMAGQARGASSAATVMIIGSAIHFALAIVMARVFLGMTAGRQLATIGLLCAGLAYGTALWAVSEILVLRLLDRVMYARVQLMPWTFFAAHLLYAAALSGFALGASEDAAGF